MIKLKLFFNIEKEEKWLNELSQNGYELISKNIFGIYRFQIVEYKRVIGIDYRNFKNKTDYLDYIALFEDSGWKHIVGSKGSGIHYFRQMSEHAGNDIFSDQISKASRYKRYSDMWINVFCVYMIFMVTLSSTGNINLNAILNPKSLYYTPGLWEKTGIQFWLAFLFETPFVLFRGFMWIIILLLLFLYMFFALKAYHQYKKNSK